MQMMWGNTQSSPFRCWSGRHADRPRVVLNQSGVEVRHLVLGRQQLPNANRNIYINWLGYKLRVQLVGLALTQQRYVLHGSSCARHDNRMETSASTRPGGQLMSPSTGHRLPMPTVCRAAHGVARTDVMIIRMRTEIPAIDKHKCYISVTQINPQPEVEFPQPYDT